MPCYQVSKRLLHHATWMSLCWYPVPANWGGGKEKRRELSHEGQYQRHNFLQAWPIEGAPRWLRHLKRYFSNSQGLYASERCWRNKSGCCLSAAQSFQFLCLSCFPRLNVSRLNITASVVHQGCVHVQRGARAALSHGVFPPLLVSVSFCLTFKPCLLTLLVKTGLYFSCLGCAGLVQVVQRGKLSSFPNINTLLANNNDGKGRFFLICWCMLEVGNVSDGIYSLLSFPGVFLNATFWPMWWREGFFAFVCQSAGSCPFSAWPGPGTHLAAWFFCTLAAFFFHTSTTL